MSVEWLQIEIHRIGFEMSKNKEFLQQKKNDNSIRCSQAVTHPSTNRTQCCLTSVIGRELVFSTWYGRCREERLKVGKI